MSAHVFQAAEEGNLRIDVVYQSTSEGECDSQENDHSTAEDSDEDSSKLDSKDEAEEGGCHCQICVRDGAYSIVTGEPLDRDLRHQNIRSGSKVLMGVILIYALIDFCVGIFVWISYHKLKEVLLAFGKFRIASHIVVQTATFISMAFCVQRPRLVIYFPTIIVWTLYTVIFWLFLPLQLINDTGGWHRKDGRLESFLNFYNPNAAGSIALHGLMWLIFLMPLLVPERRLMPLVSRLWIGLFFGIMSLCIGVWPEPKPNEKVEGVTVTQSLERYRYNFDLTVSVLFLGAGFLIVYTRKQAIEEDQLTISRLDQQKQGVSEHMFSILGCMVPAFLLEPMLKDPDRTKPIAEKMDPHV